MKPNKVGTFHKASNHVEMEALKDDDYDAFMKRAVEACNISAKEGKVLTLFKMNGAVIRDVPVMLKGYCSERPWTIGNYLQLMKKSASQVKIGIGLMNAGHLTSSDEGSCSSSEDVVCIFALVIRLIPLYQYCNSCFIVVTQWKEAC